MNEIREIFSHELPDTWELDLQNMEKVISILSLYHLDSAGYRASISDIVLLLKYIDYPLSIADIDPKVRSKINNLYTLTGEFFRKNRELVNVAYENNKEMYYNMIISVLTKQ